MANVLQRLGDGIAKKWCYFVHPDPMWPVRGMYQCPRCHRKFPVPWEEKGVFAGAPTSQTEYQSPMILDPISDVADRIHA